MTLDDARAHLQKREFAEAVEILERITEREPENAHAWRMLGGALHQAGEMDRALAAHIKAAAFPETASGGMYNAARVHARQGRKAEAFEWLGRAVATGRIDPISMWQDNDLKSLHEEAKFRALLPKPAELEDPFVEQVRVIHEWRGENEDDEFGWIARDIGDVDADGVHDVTTSAPSWNDGAGRVYAYSGKSGALLWKVSGEAGSKLGAGIEAAGDVDADGVADVIAGAPAAGRAYVYSGKDGKLLLTLRSESDGDRFGRKVSDLGDWNGDGHDDVVVGAPGHDASGEDAGRAYVFSGKDGSVLLRIDGERAGDGFGSSAAGWIGAEQRLLVIGAPGAGEPKRGRVYVYRDGSGKAAFTIDPEKTGIRLGGMFVSVVGDVDRDGMPDVYGSDWHDTTHGRMTGRIYVHSGKTGERLHSIAGESAGGGFGIGSADAGDVNGDGHDDLIVGAWRQGNAAISAGKAYLYSGRDGSLLRPLTCRATADTFGFDATGVGDVDGDGTIDLLITSAWSFVNGPKSGRIFVVSGK